MVFYPSIGIFVIVSVFALLFWSVRVNNRRWNAVAGKLNGHFRAFSGLALRRQITGSFRNHVVEIKEVSGSRNVLPGTSIKLYMPIRFYLRLWSKRTVVFYPNLKKIEIREIDSKYDLYDAYDLYTDDLEQATSFLNSAVRRTLIKNLALKGGMEISPDSILCVMHKKPIPDDPLKREKASEGYERIVRVLEMMESLGAEGRSAASLK